MVSKEMRSSLYFTSIEPTSIEVVLWYPVLGTGLEEYFLFFISLHQRNTKYELEQKEVSLNCLNFPARF